MMYESCMRRSSVVKKQPLTKRVICGRVIVDFFKKSGETSRWIFGDWAPAGITYKKSAMEMTSVSAMTTCYLEACMGDRR